MSDEIDPEVLADLRLRASSMYDTSRTRPVDVNQLVPRPTLATEWRCRFPGQNGSGPCRVMIPVDEQDVENLAMHNAELAARRARGDLDKTQPIETHEVMLCDAHRRLANDYRAKKLPEHHAELRDAIQKLKQSGQPRTERALLDVLHKRHHPDIEGLLQSLTEKLGGNKRKGAGV